MAQAVFLCAATRQHRYNTYSRPIFASRLRASVSPISRPLFPFIATALSPQSPPKASPNEPSIKDSTAEQDSPQLNNRAIRRKNVTPYAFSMPNPLKNIHFKNEFLISSRIFLQKVAQKIEQKNAQQAHMTINQYLITKGAEIIRLLGIEACVRYTKKRLFPRGYRCHHGRRVGDEVLGWKWYLFAPS